MNSRLSIHSGDTENGSCKRSSHESQRRGCWARQGADPPGFSRIRTCARMQTQSHEAVIVKTSPAFFSFFLHHTPIHIHHLHAQPSANVPPTPPTTPRIASTHHSKHRPPPAISGSRATASATPSSPARPHHTPSATPRRRAGFMYSSHANALAVDPAHVEQSFRILRKPRSCPHRNTG